MALMYIHTRPSFRFDQPLDDLDDDYLMAVEGASAALIAPDSGTLDDIIMDTYDRLGLA